MWCVYVYFFFFKQKTAYELRISDWSSDVCSSDLQILIGGIGAQLAVGRHQGVGNQRPVGVAKAGAVGLGEVRRQVLDRLPENRFFGIVGDQRVEQIGRASCRERVCQYV